MEGGSPSPIWRYSQFNNITYDPIIGVIIRDFLNIFILEISLVIVQITMGSFAL
jgi:hypothetical protein